MKVIIDRFEGKYAICEKENLDMIDIEISKLPEDAKEGDVLILTEDKIIIDREETKARRERIKKLMDDLWE